MIITLKKILLIVLISKLASSCYSSQYYIGGTCCSYSAVGCAACAYSWYQCSSCQNTYCMDGTICTPCSSKLSQCSTCSSCSSCLTCSTNQYAVNSSRCVLCSSLLNACSTCSSASACTTCTNNSYALNVTQCVLCSTLMNLCTNCVNSTACIACTISPNIILNNLRCAYCRTVIPNCLNCTSNSYCTVCSRFYTVRLMLNLTADCVLCAKAMAGCRRCSSLTVCTVCNYGHIVTNGCSVVPGCIQKELNQSMSACSNCNATEYYLDNATKACICLRGHLAGQYCTEIVGCTNVLRTVSGEVCSICDKGKHFALLNGTCVCEAYYEIQGQTCGDICGDGKVLTLPCDDGNLIDGDGCSSTCQIEPSYICKPNAVGKSLCTYKGQIKLGLSCINKQEENIAQVVLKFQPFVSNILKSDFGNKIFFYSDKRCQMNKYSITSSGIQILVGFQQNIDGSSANVTIYFDQNYILSPNYTLPFNFIQCNGDKFIYDAEAGKSYKQLIMAIARVVSFLVLLVWLVGSYAHKMIGVQTLHTFHLIFLAQCFSKRYSPVVINFGELHNTQNLCQNYLINQQIISTYPYSRLKYFADFINNNSVLIASQLIVFLLLCCLNFYQKLADASSKTTNQRRNLARTIKYKNILYDFLVFPLFIGFFLNLAISLLIQFDLGINKIINSQIQAISTVIMSALTFLVFFGEWKYIFIKENKAQQIHKKCYVPLYLTSLLIFTVIIQASILSLIENPLFCISAFEFASTVMLLFYQPYKDFLHNLSLIVNKICIAINLGWVVSQEYVYLKRPNEQMVAFVILGLMILVLLMACLRIGLQLKKSICKEQAAQIKDQSLKTNRQKLLSQVLKQNLKKFNAYRIHQQVAREKQLDRLQQRQRQKIRTQFLKSKALSRQHKWYEPRQDRQQLKKRQKQMYSLMKQLRNKFYS